MSKEKSCLITQNLISTVDWFLSAPDSVIKEEKGGDGKLTWAQKASQDLHDLINRVPGDFPEAARRGVEFEKQVYKYAKQEIIPDKFSNEFKQVCSFVKEYDFYKKGGRKLNVEGHDCYLYAKYDAIKSPSLKEVGEGESYNKLVDIKTTDSYSSSDKYLKGIQHKLYCYTAGADRFVYIIVEWEKYPKIKKLHSEVYTVSDFETLEKELKSKILQTFEVLKDVNLWEAYKETYCLY